MTAAALAGLVSRKNSGTTVALVLNRFFQARIRDVIIVALTAERIPAAFDTTVRTNRKSAVGTSSHGTLAARHPVAIAGHVFNLAVH